VSEPTYYDLPLLKPPVWTWEIPLYFFVGGAAGAASVIGFAGRITGAKPSIVRDARWIAAIGANVSAPLLISDLGRPERFLNMLRVFKPQSAMSVGAWALAGFGAFSTAAVVGPRVLRDVAAAGSAFFGLVMSTYTGVLLGVTAISAWNEHASTLPVHFAASALASATSLLELRDHDEPALNALAALAAAFETWTGYQLERRSRVAQASSLRPGRRLEACATREAAPSTAMRTAGVLSGPVPLALRLIGMKSKKARRVAAAITIAGSLVTRFAWVEAGKKSAAQAMRS
jgi:formate-dependent nitrite reductase membrane component NrfD